MKRLGPELKMPDFGKAKVPGPVADLFYDLRDRRLLPLVGLILVAIVAAPFLLGEGSEETPAPPAAGGKIEKVEASSLTVAEAHPGLRDFRKRLKGHTATDPFKQHFTGAAGNGGLADEEASTSTSTSSSGSEGGPSTTVETAPPAGSGGGGIPSTGAEPEIQLFTFSVDVRIIRTQTRADGSKDKSEPETREEVVPPAALPSEKSQVVTYMGISPKTSNPLFLVSDEVEAVFGEGKCISGAEKCQLLEVETGLPTTFVYGPTGARYKITVLKVKPVIKGQFKD